MIAIVIAAAPHSGTTAAPTDASLAGLSLTLRALLTLQQQGATSLLAATTTAQAAALKAEPRLTVPLTVVPLTGAGAVDWQALAALVDEPYALVRHDRLLSPDGYRALLEHSLEPAHREPADAEPTHGVLAFTDAYALRATPEWLPRLAELRWEEGGLLDATGAPAASTAKLGADWTVNANTEVGCRDAVDRLFNACRKPVDGLVSRHFNRHVSLWLSRRLVNTSVTPNSMTMVTFGVGLIAAFFATRGGYANTLAAAALMQLNSILDGCDGELARVRFQGSKLGQWLDTIGDDVSNVIFWTALGFGALHVPDVPWLSNAGTWLAYCAWIAAAGNALAAAQYYALLWRLGSGDFYAIQQDDKPPAEGVVGAVVRFFTLVLKQDFFLMLVLLLALAGVLMWSLPIMALGAIITLLSATSRTIKARGMAQSSAGNNGAASSSGG